MSILFYLKTTLKKTLFYKTSINYHLIRYGFVFGQGQNNWYAMCVCLTVRAGDSTWWLLKFNLIRTCLVFIFVFFMKKWQRLTTQFPALANSEAVWNSLGIFLTLAFIGLVTTSRIRLPLWENEHQCCEVCFLVRILDVKIANIQFPALSLSEH